jgi:prevent-host-death family protein
MERVGIRELRRDISQLVRRAASGERIVITVDGEPRAELVPLRPTGDRPTLDELIASGRVIPPRRRGPHRRAPEPVELTGGSKLTSDIVDELRGER